MALSMHLVASLQAVQFDERMAAGKLKHMLDENAFDSVQHAYGKKIPQYYPVVKC